MGLEMDGGQDVTLEEKIEDIRNRMRHPWRMDVFLGAEARGARFYHYTYASKGCWKTAEELILSGSVESGLVLISRAIRDACIVECLTSPSQYIRDYREWYESRR